MPGLIGTTRSACHFEMSLADVGFDLLFGHFVGRNVATMPNAGQNGTDVSRLRTRYETGKVHVVNETLT